MRKLSEPIVPKDGSHLLAGNQHDAGEDHSHEGVDQHHAGSNLEGEARVAGARAGNSCSSWRCWSAFSLSAF